MHVCATLRRAPGAPSLRAPGPCLGTQPGSLCTQVPSQPSVLDLLRPPLVLCVHSCMEDVVEVEIPHPFRVVCSHWS